MCTDVILTSMGLYLTISHVTLHKNIQLLYNYSIYNKYIKTTADTKNIIIIKYFLFKIPNYIYV